MPYIPKSRDQQRSSTSSCVESSENIEWDRGAHERPKLKPEANGDSSIANQKLLFEKCQKLANKYVKQAIAEQDAYEDFKRPHYLGIRNFIRKVSPEDLEESPRSTAESAKPSPSRHSPKNYTKSRELTPRGKSDTEMSQMQSSSEESKSFSQIYSEIYEESRARQEKAEQFYRAYTNKNTNHSDEYLRCKSRERTARWVQNLGEPDTANGTEVSNESEQDSEGQQSMDENNFTKQEYKYLVQEQLDAIAQYRQDLRREQPSCSELSEAFSEADESEAKNQGGMSHISHSIDDDYNSESNGKRSHRTDLSDMSSIKTSAEDPSRAKVKKETQILQFEHCEIYVSPSKVMKKTEVEAVDQIMKESPKQADESSSSSIRYANVDTYDRHCGYKGSKGFSLLEEELSCQESDVSEINGEEELKLSPNLTREELSHRNSSYEDDLPEANDDDSINSFRLEADSFSCISSKASNRSASRMGESSSRRSSNRGGEDELTFRSSTSRISNKKTRLDISGKTLQSQAPTEVQKPGRSLGSISNRQTEQCSSGRSSRGPPDCASPSSREEQRKSKGYRSRGMSQITTDCSSSFEERKSLEKSYRHSKLNKAANSNYKQLQSTSESYNKNCDEVLNNSMTDDDYNTNSRNVTPSSSSRSARKTYRDRASSPINVLYSEEFKAQLDIKQMEVEDMPEGEALMEKLPRSKGSRNSRKLEKRSQTSISSEEKAVQYPSGDELKASPKRGKEDREEYKLDEAHLKLGRDEEGELLTNHYLGDDELKTQTKLTPAQDFSNNSSSHSLPTGHSRNTSSTVNSSAFSISSYVPSERFYRRTQPEPDVQLNLSFSEKDTPAMRYKKHVARLAEHALRTCTSYYEERSLGLEQDIAAKVEMLYNSETQFNTPKRIIQRDELLQQFNQQLQQQLKLIAPSFQ